MRLARTISCLPPAPVRPTQSVTRASEPRGDGTATAPATNPEAPKQQHTQKLYHPGHDRLDRARWSSRDHHHTAARGSQRHRPRDSRAAKSGIRRHQERPIPISVRAHRRRWTPLRGHRATHCHRAAFPPDRAPLSKPWIAAVEGYAVARSRAMRIASTTAVFGVYCSAGAGDTLRLPRISRSRPRAGHDPGRRAPSGPADRLVNQFKRAAPRSS